MLDVHIYLNGAHLTKQTKWTNAPCIGDQILWDGRFLTITKRVFRGEQNSIELYVEEFEQDQILKPDLISKDDPDYQQKRDRLLKPSNPSNPSNSQTHA